MNSLFFAIEEAETSHENAAALFEAILKLSDNETAIAILVEAYGEAVTETEIQWRAIELSPEFKARYSNRDAALADFLRHKFKEHTEDAED